MGGLLNEQTLRIGVVSKWIMIVITISVGNNRMSKTGSLRNILLSEFYEKLHIPNRSTETLNEYLNLKKSEQDEKKTSEVS